MLKKDKYNLDNFKNNGVSWPHSISKKFNKTSLSKNYLKFKKRSEDNLGMNISLKPHILSKFFYNLATDPMIIKKVKKIIGKDIYIWSSAFFVKAPGEGKIVSFHQDNPYWQLTTNKVVTAWVALSNSNEKNGALQAVPRSHKSGLIKRIDVKNARKSYLKGKKTTPENDLLSYSQNLEKFIKYNKPLIIDLKAGEFSIHHINTVHGSGVNNSKNYRMGYAIRYVSSDTQHQEEDNDFATHVSGKANKYYNHETKPDGEFTKSSIEQYKISMNSTGVF